MNEFQIPLSDKLLETLYALNRTEQFKGASYAEIIQFLLQCGIETEGVSV